MKHGFFEGWYYKLQKDDFVIAFIPGWHRKQTGEESAFLQVAYGDKSHYLSFPYSAFSFLNDPYEIILDHNFFTKTEIALDLETDELSIHGSVRFGFLSELPKSLYLPNIMGPFSYVPGLECRHDVISMGHRLMGSLCINGQTVDFTGGKGYIERDFGSSFPASWLWCQCNDFRSHGQLMLAVAKVPCAGLLFNGLICFLVTDEGEHLFATYNGGKVSSIAASDKAIALTLKKREYSMQLIIKGDNRTGLALLAPEKGGMVRSMKETISCSVDVLLTKNGQALYHSLGRHGGFEQVGSLLQSGSRLGFVKSRRQTHKSPAV